MAGKKQKSGGDPTLDKTENFIQISTMTVPDNSLDHNYVYGLTSNGRIFRRDEALDVPVWEDLPMPTRKP